MKPKKPQKSQPKNQPKGTGGNVMMILFYLAMGLFCGGVMGATLVYHDPQILLPWILLELLFLYAGLLFHIILHEAGHGIFGKRSGYTFCSFRIGPFLWLKRDGKIILKRYSLPGTAGQCLMRPPQWTEDGIPYKLYNLGGVLMNFIAMGVFLALGLLFPVGSVAWCLMMTLAIEGLFLGASNGIPMRTSTVNNDGRNAADLGQDKAALWAFWAQLELNALQTENLRLKDMPAELFVLPKNAPKDAITTTIRVVAAQRLMDAGDYPAAKKAMDLLLSGSDEMAGLHRSLLECDRLTLCLLLGEKTEDTKALKKFRKTMKAYPSTLRTEYAVAKCIEKNPAKAEEVKKKLLSLQKNYPYPAELQSELEIVEELGKIA